MTVLAATDVWAAPPGGEEAVVRGVSLELRQGEWVALSGPNGGGKTTLALALAGLRPLLRGSVRLDSETREGAAQRVGLSVILQDPSAQLFTSSVSEELAYTARNLGQAPSQVAREVARWATRLALERDLSRDPHTLSAGRQQLVLLGAALAPGPRLLIADEPGAHLDSEARERVIQEVRAEVTDGLSVLWLTQAKREIEAADRLIWIGEAASSESAAPGGWRASVSRESPGHALAEVRIAPGGAPGGPGIRVSAPVEFEIPARGVVVLNGPNASGKSVLLASLCGLATILQVSVSWLERVVPPPLLVSQYPETQLFQEFVKDELLYAAVSRGLARAEALDRASEGLARLGLAPGYLERRCWELSSGERRLIEVLAGLIAPAGLLALDEPSGGLDPARGAALSDLIRERSESGPVVVASQDETWARRLEGAHLELGQDAEKGLPSLSKKTD